MRICGHRLLIVEDEPLLRITMADALRKEGWAVDVAEDGVRHTWRSFSEALESILRARAADWIVDRAVEAMREGAADFIAKPFSMAQLVVRLSNVCSVRILREQNVRLQAQLEQRHSFSNIIGKTKKMLEVFQNIFRRVSDCPRRKRHRQGDGGVRDSLQLRAPRQALRAGQLCFPARVADRV